MPKRSPEKGLNAIIRDALVPRGLRPTSLGDIEALLDAVGGGKPSAEKLARMLRRARGEEERIAPSMAEEGAPQVFTHEEQKLLAFYRGKGKEIPPEIRVKLDAMRRRARGQGEGDNGT